MNPQHYLITLAVRSRLGTPLAADTLWGHVAWGIRYRRGTTSLVEWLEAYEGDQPPLVLSDPCPAGTVPRALLPKPPLPAERPLDSDFDRAKEIDKAQWIPRDVWTVCRRSLSDQALLGHLGAGGRRAEVHDGFVTGTLVHAGINRLTGGTAAEAGGLLFSSEERFPGASQLLFDMRAVAHADALQVRAWLDDGLAGGYGRDASAGAGRVHVHSVVPVEPDTLDGANAWVTMAPCVPRPSDPTAGFLRFTVRCGRLGGLYAQGPTDSGSEVRQKRPIHALARGSVLVGPHAPGWMGRVLRGVHDDPTIRHHALTVVMPCRLTDATVREARS